WERGEHSGSLTGPTGGRGAGNQTGLVGSGDPAGTASSPFPSQSGRQESDLPSTAYQTVASPLGFGPILSALYGTRTRLACSTGRSPHLLRHRAEECPAGVAPAYPTRQGEASGARRRALLAEGGRYDPYVPRRGW